MTKKPKSHDDPDAPMTAIIGAIGVFVVFLIIVGLQALFYHVQKEQTREKTYGFAFDQLRTAQSGQLQQLHTYRWVDQTRGVVAIPIDRAMELTVAELQRAAATQPFSQEPMP